MARYMERAENLSRLLVAHHHLRLDAGAAATANTDFWELLLMATGDDEGYRARHPVIAGPDVSRYLSLMEENPNSIRNCVRAARENARMVRDQIADDLWQSLNDLHLHLNSPRMELLQAQDPEAFHESVLRGSYLFQGIAMATMARTEGWLFMQIGTYLERSDKTSRLLDACSSVSLELPPHPDARPMRWAALLHSSSAYHVFHESSPVLDPSRIIGFLLLDPHFPRSVRFCVESMYEALIALGRPPGGLAPTDPFRLAGMLRSGLEYALTEEILAAGLHNYIDALQLQLNALGSSIFQSYVLYPDLLSANAGINTVDRRGRDAAWHPGDEGEIRVQQQQQQQ